MVINYGVELSHSHILIYAYNLYMFRVDETVCCFCVSIAGSICLAHLLRERELCDQFCLMWFGVYGEWKFLLDKGEGWLCDLGDEVKRLIAFECIVTSNYHIVGPRK